VRTALLDEKDPPVDLPGAENPRDPVELRKADDEDRLGARNDEPPPGA